MSAGESSGARCEFIHDHLKNTAPELEDFDFGIFHPLVNLVQMFNDPADPINYRRLWFAEPIEGIPPKSILQVKGMGDTYEAVS